MYIMPFAFGLLAVVMIGTVLVGGYLEERRALACTEGEDSGTKKHGCCAH